MFGLVSNLSSSKIQRHTIFVTFQFSQEKKVGIISASPMSMGLLTDSGPPIWHPAGKDLREACAKAAEFCRVSRKIRFLFFIKLSVKQRHLINLLKN